MPETERRSDEHHTTREMRAELNEAQRDTLATLERYGWSLKFVRHPLFQPSVPVVFDADRNAFGVLEADGALNEHPDFDIRHG